MASPWKHPTTGAFYLRDRVPLDLAPRTKGRKVSVPVDGRSRDVTLGEFVKVSLGTKEPKLAKERYREAAAAVQEMWQRFRQEAATGPVRLTAKQVEALAGRYYHDIVAQHGDDPGDPDDWDAAMDVFSDLAGLGQGQERVHGQDADRLLQQEGLAVDAESRTRLLEAMNRAYAQAARVLRRRGWGDFSTDPEARRFPEMPKQPTETTAPRSGETATLSDLFDLWKADHLLAGKSKRTVRDFRRKLDSLTEFLGHEDVGRITPRLVSDWVEHLRHEEGMSAKTVGQKYLAVVRRVLTVGMDKFRITDNPAAKVKVTVPKAVRTRSPGFTDDEAKAILSAALRSPETLGPRWGEDNKRAILWGPWLCAYNGARIGEMMQLRKQDVETHHGIPCLRITPEAGSVKSGNYRVVPIHPHLIEMGFLNMVAKRPDGYLFFTFKEGDDPVTRAGSVGGEVSEWVRKTVGIKGKVQPNHGWRHRLKIVAREVGIPPENIDAIQGHEDGRASTDYGEFTIKLLRDEVERLPRYNVREAEGPNPITH